MYLLSTKHVIYLPTYLPTYLVSMPRWLSELFSYQPDSKPLCRPCSEMYVPTLKTTKTHMLFFLTLSSKLNFDLSNPNPTNHYHNYFPTYQPDPKSLWNSRLCSKISTLTTVTDSRSDVPLLCVLHVDLKPLKMWANRTLPKFFSLQ